MVRIYVEGGSTPNSSTNCRRAFKAFFGKVVSGSSLKVTACGDRGSTYRNFCLALKTHPGDYNILLVDSEEAVSSTSAWEHLAKREGDGWLCPEGVGEDQAHLMVQVMESWLLADAKELSAYYGIDFHESSLPAPSNNIERVGKKDVFQALKGSTKGTKKGKYDKVQHGFSLLERIDPIRVRSVSNFADRLLKVLERELAPKAKS